MARVEEPHIPTLRAATPVYDQHDKLFGMVILNLDFSRILNRLASSIATNRFLYITNTEGNFLVHPDSRKNFGFDLGKSYRIQDEIPDLDSAFYQFGQQSEITLQTSIGKQKELVLLVKAFFDNYQPNRFLAIVQTMPRNVVTAHALKLQRRSLFLALVFAGISAIIALYFAKLLTRPLQQITHAALLASSGERDARLPTQQQDEIGVLARAFQKMLVDIKEREQALNASEKRLRATYDTVVNGIVTIDEQGIICALNPAIEKIFGYRSEELIGQNIKILMSPHYAEQHDNHIRNYLETGNKKVMGTVRELTGQYNDGRQFPIHLSINETVIQGHRFFIGAIQDLTELQSSKERTRRLGKILQASSNEIHVFEYPGLQLLESNMASCSNLKYTPERLAQMALFDLFPESEHTSLQEALNKLGNVSSNEQQFESLFRRQDNSLYPVELRLLVSEGKVGTVGVLIAQDITERQHHLEKLKSYAQRLESSNRDLQDYAFVASHDLQEPLRKIQAFGDRLKAYEAERLSERGLDYLERMQRAAARLQLLISDLLTLSLVNTKGKPFERVDLEHLARAVIDGLDDRFQAIGGQIDLEQLPTVLADPLQMRQVLQRLFDNALKFHSADRTLQVRISSKWLDTTSDSPAQYRIIVEDNGIGFDDEYAERIFAPFERLNSYEICRYRHGAGCVSKNHRAP